VVSVSLEVDFAVIGAGLAGLATAVALRSGKRAAAEMLAADAAG
jgi:cation diffusion facilitator CzcD-associated flavoprotein CzcO